MNGKKILVLLIAASFMILPNIALAGQAKVNEVKVFKQKQCRERKDFYQKLKAEKVEFKKDLKNLPPEERK